MGTRFREEGQVRLLFDQYANAMVDSVVEAGNKAKEYILEKRRDHRGDAYLDQLEKNSIYLSEGTYALCVAIAQYLAAGTPRLSQNQIMSYVLQTRMTQPQQSTPYHLNFLRQGCAGCPVHKDHGRYAELRELRLSGNQSEYLNELELACKYGQASFTLSQLFLAAFLQDHSLAASAKDIRIPNLLDVALERVGNWTHITIVGYQMRQSQQLGHEPARDLLNALRASPYSFSDKDANQGKAKNHFEQGMVYFRQGQLGKAISEWQTILRTDPDNAEAHYYLGVVYGMQGRVGEAIHEYETALRINPDHAKAHCNLGEAYMVQDRWNEAVREFKVALRLNPNLADAHLGLGFDYAQKGCLDEAMREFQVAVRLNPSMAEAHVGLGHVYWLQNRESEAIRELRIAVQLGSQQARALLAEIGL